MPKTASRWFRVDLPELNRRKANAMKRSLRASKKLTPRLTRTMFAVIDFAAAGMTSIAWPNLARVLGAPEEAVQEDVRALERVGVLKFTEAPPAEDGAEDGEFQLGPQGFADAVDILIESGAVVHGELSRAFWEAGVDLPDPERGLPPWEQLPPRLRLLLAKNYVKACDRYLKRQRQKSDAEFTEEDRDNSILIVIFQQLQQLDLMRLERALEQ